MHVIATTVFKQASRLTFCSEIQYFNTLMLPKLTSEKKVRQNAEVIAEKKKDEVSSNTAICLERSMILY